MGARASEGVRRDTEVAELLDSSQGPVREKATKMVGLGQILVLLKLKLLP